jgi:hypothetical protein
MGIILIIVIIFVLAYYVSLRTHPYTKCKGCNGSPRVYNPVFPDAFRLCRKCGGTGRRERFGAKFARGDRS